MNKLLLTVTLATLCVARTFAAPIGTGFTYQGRLNDGGQPATGKYDMIFNLYDDPTNGNVLGTYSIFGGVPVTNGSFTVELNAYGEFGTNAFNGQARWLQIGVRTNSNNAMNPWVYLSPRQAIHSAPQAMFAEKAANATRADIAATVADGAITTSKLASGVVQPGNLAPGSLAWSNLTGIPACFADGVDDGVFYKAGKGLNLDWLFEFSVNFAGSGSANSAARSDHDHFGTTWGGSASLVNGLSVTNGANNSAGLYGQQGTGSGFPYLFGNTAGVWGESSQGNGVWGATGHTNGSGVVGMGATTKGSNAGVTGFSISTSGIGVRGSATAQTGETIGVRGESVSGDGTGVLGIASAEWGDATGVRGESAAPQGTGLFGRATYTYGPSATYGVVGKSDSTWGYGVYGQTTATNGVKYGVVGQADSKFGFGVVARNTRGAAFKAEGTGVIQSDADSYLWIPASAAYGADGTAGIERDGPQMIVKERFGNGNNTVHCPLMLPGVLYGQRTMLRSIEVFFTGGDEEDNYIYSTTVYETYNPNNPAHESTAGIYPIYRDWVDRYDNNYQHTSYTVPLNYAFSDTSGFLLLELFFIVDSTNPIYLQGFKVRLSHK